MTTILEQIKHSINSINKDECHYSKDLNELKEKTVDTTIIVDILNNEYMYHKDMDAVNCMLNSYLRQNLIGNNKDYLVLPDDIHNIAKKNNTTSLKSNINTQIKNIRPLSSGTVSSEVYLADLLVNDISMVIKFPNKSHEADKIEFMKEYIIGKSINKLRRITPAFMYTFSLFGCGMSKSKGNKICTTKKSLPLLILEKVNGKSMEKFIKEPSTTFEDWLKVYVQVLLNLEIAQKLYKFNHNDLHHENVMVRKEKNPITYCFNTETKTYKVTTDTFPVLIDFGYSGMDVYDKHIEGVTLGVAFSAKYVPCYDMYLHLARCIFPYYIKEKSKYTPDVKKMFGLYEFFTDDPYSIYNNNNNLFANNDWFEKINYNNCITKTPGEFLDWILDRYGNILSNTITISKRETYINPLPNQQNMYNNFYVSKYHEIIPLNTNTKVINKIIDKFTTCTSNQDYQSYIMSVQTYKILESMTDNVNNHVVNKTKKIFTDMISDKKRKNILIATDLYRLNTFFTNTHFEFIKDSSFDKEKLENMFDLVGSIKRPTTSYLRKLVSGSQFSQSINLINKIDGMIDFERHMKGYYNIYLTIKELKLTEYKDWVSKFENSDIFKYYQKLADRIDRYKRYKFTYLKLSQRALSQIIVHDNI